MPDNYDIPPEYVDMILGSYADEPKIEQLRRQQAMAQGLQSQAVGENSPGFMAGRVFVPTGVGTALGRAAGGFFGARQAQQAYGTPGKAAVGAEGQPGYQPAVEGTGLQGIASGRAARAKGIVDLFGRRREQQDVDPYAP